MGFAWGCFFGVGGMRWRDGLGDVSAATGDGGFPSVLPLGGFAWLVGVGESVCCALLCCVVRCAFLGRTNRGRDEMCCAVECDDVKVCWRLHWRYVRYSKQSHGCEWVSLNARLRECRDAMDPLPQMLTSRTFRADEVYYYDYVRRPACPLILPFPISLHVPAGDRQSYIHFGFWQIPKQHGYDGTTVQILGAFIACARLPSSFSLGDRTTPPSCPSLRRSH
jgi:hypothetical protein